MLLNIKITLLLLSIIAFFSSCSDFENNIYINADGSGKVNMKYDASEMVAMAEMMKGMEEGGEEEEIMEEENNEGDLNSMLSDLGNPGNLKDMDSTFTFYEVMPDSLKKSITNPDLLKNVSMTINTSRSEMTAVMGMEMKYKNLNELEQTFEMLKQMGDNKEEEKNQMESFKELIRDYEADLEQGIVVLPEQDFSGDFGEGTGSQDMDFDNMSEEETGMMNMMLGESGYVTTIHLPGDVTSCDDVDAVIDGNTITIRDTYITLMKENKFKARTIKFKVK